jgi:hypothetical protein
MQYLLFLLCATKFLVTQVWVSWCFEVSCYICTVYNNPSAANPVILVIYCLYNNPSAANPVILVIYCCRLYNLYVNKSRTIIIKLVPKNRYLCIDPVTLIPKKWPGSPASRYCKHYMRHPLQTDRHHRSWQILTSVRRLFSWHISRDLQLRSAAVKAVQPQTTTNTDVWSESTVQTSHKAVMLE